MKYISTNKQSEPVSFQQAVFNGLPADNGLFMPEYIPCLSKDFFKKLPILSLPEIGFEVSKTLIDGEIPDEDLRALCLDAFNFPVPVVQIADDKYALELFHGPTLAFKDFGARFMARVMSWFLQKDMREINILVATSGDTGSAVAQGFLNVPGIHVTILYPKGRVSYIQEQQLTTNGANITALEIDGSFDDCQALVKQAFLDKELNQRLQLSSANSINIARLIPQSFYYFYAAAQFPNEKLTFCTPSGNFGNLSGGLLAHCMGLPVRQFIAATNENDVVPVYLKTGVFEPKKSKVTLANAMDVGNPSNFPRLLHLMHHDHSNIVKWIQGASISDDSVKDTIYSLATSHHYLACPHTAVGYQALYQHLPKDAIGLVLATAHPAKFQDIVANASKLDVMLPPALQQLVDRKKEAIPMTNRYEDFKDWLSKK